MSRRWSWIIAILAMSGAIVAGCGDDESGDEFGVDDAAEQVEDDLGDQLGDAVGGGGGGSLVFDGEEIPIDSVTCQLGDDTFDVGTVSSNDFRVLLSRSNPANDASAQVLDADFVQWFPQDVSGDEVQRDGGTFTSEPTTYFNNQDDRTVEVSFTVECP